VAENATVARPYAHAAFETAHAAGQLARWGEVLSAAGTAISDERVAVLLGNPHVRKADLVGLLAEVAGVAGDEKLHNFLHLLADNGRLPLLPEIATQYAALRADVENTVEVTVTSALPLTAEQSAKLVEALKKRLGRTVRLHAEVDPALVGGAVVRAGDFVVDGSLRGRIERLGNIMAGA
jgi:F-type H+-transporting ATPase subunit delta